MVSIAVIALTAAASFIGFSSPRFIRGGMLVPSAVVRTGRVLPVLTSGFLHADLGHLFMNMLTLFFFAPTMEQILGGGGFLVLYIGSIIAGSLVTTLFYHRDPTYRALGASGGVSGVLFGYILFRPFARLDLFLIPIGIPAILFAIGYLVVSAYGARRRSGRIGHAAHLGGAVGGIVLTSILEPAALRFFLSHFR